MEDWYANTIKSLSCLIYFTLSNLFQLKKLSLLYAQMVSLLCFHTDSQLLLQEISVSSLIRNGHLVLSIECYASHCCCPLPFLLDTINT